MTYNELRQAICFYKYRCPHFFGFIRADALRWNVVLNEYRSIKNINRVADLSKTKYSARVFESLDRADKDGLHIQYLFVDNNTDEASKALLGDFGRRNDNVKTIPGKQLNKYQCTEVSHYWNNELMNTVGEYKDRIIEYAIENEFDYIFLIPTF